MPSIQVNYRKSNNMGLRICLISVLSNDDVTRVLIKSLARPGRKQATATEDFDFYISYL
jgi:hypothetical protein